MPIRSKRWHVAPPAPSDFVARFPHLHPVVLQVLYNRKVTDPTDVARFLDGAEDGANPFALPDMVEAVTRLRQALRAEEPIAVYGDFDADGVTATALLVQALRALGGEVHPYIPHRVDEGYGVHAEALTELAQTGIRVLVTVDCGTRALEEMTYARKLGIDTIITDHHSVGEELPQVVAVINPKRKDSNYPFRELAGVGVAYRLAQSLLRSQRQAPITTREVRLEEQDLVDLVAVGTVADLVPLQGENRTLVQKGLERINLMERPGIEALCRQARIKGGQIDTTAIGYSLGPRLNAAGRVAHAKVAYQLLETRYPAEAEHLAEVLNRLNQKRQKITFDTQAEARRIVLDNLEDAFILFAADPAFSSGIVGVVASRLVDEFYRPAIVIEKGTQVCRGSARSIPEFNITEALDRCADLLLHHGGHAAAAGFTVPTGQLDELAGRLQELAAEQLAGVELTPALDVDLEIDLPEMTWELQEKLAQLEPNGYGNLQPLFLSRNVQVISQRAVGDEGKHLKLRLSQDGAVRDSIAFRQGEWAGKLSDRVDVVYHLEINEWNNRRNLQLNVQDIRPSGMDETSARMLATPAAKEQE